MAKKSKTTKRTLDPEDMTVLTPADVAKRLKMSERTVLGLLRAGELPGRKIGRQWRTGLAELRVFVGD